MYSSKVLKTLKSHKNTVFSDAVTLYDDTHPQVFYLT